MFRLFREIVDFPSMPPGAELELAYHVWIEQSSVRAAKFLSNAGNIIETILFQTHQLKCTTEEPDSHRVFLWAKKRMLKRQGHTYSRATFYT